MGVKLRKCIRCMHKKDLTEYVWAYHFEPVDVHDWCRACQFGHG